MTKIEGGCLCGAVRYKMSRDPVLAGQCCCIDCRKASGTGHTTIAGFMEDEFELSGETKSYASKGDSGGDVIRYFCGICGGRLFSRVDAAPGLIILQAGSMDDPEQITPSIIYYAKDKISWDELSPDIPTFESVPE